MNDFPSIGDYNQTIQKKRGTAFRSLHGINIVPSRTMPIMVFLFGSGAFAVVFKGWHLEKTYALRCFLTAGRENIERYKIICRHLHNINASWVTPCELLENEIEVKGVRYPVLKMEWIEGVLINNFVSQNLTNPNVLTTLQEKLVALSTDLERNEIGHGDLQCGNIIVTGSSNDFDLRLIDYDGMFVPGLKGRQSLEKGRSEFQHPKRTLQHFTPEIDRFSFWVMLTALEALKHDRSLWDEVMQGGFNTLDNFLFTIQDFTNPSGSALFRRLAALNSAGVKFYLDKLKTFCFGDIIAVEKPHLLGTTPPPVTHQPTPASPLYSYSKSSKKSNEGDNFQILSNTHATVLTSTFKKLGTTPLELDKTNFSGKIVVVTTGQEIKQVELRPSERIYRLRFEKIKDETERSNVPVLSKKEDLPLEKEPFTASSLTTDEEPGYTGAYAAIERSRQERLERERQKKVEESKASLSTDEESGYKEAYAVIEKARLERLERERQKEVEQRQAREKQERLQREEWDKKLREKNRRLAKEKVEREKIEKEKKERLKKRKRIKIFIWSIVIVLILAALSTRINPGKFAFAAVSAGPTVTETLNYDSIILEFLQAEKERNFPVIASFFAPSVERYYNETSPSLSAIERIYKDSWQSISRSRNEVEKIVKRPGNQYDVHITFTYYDGRTSTEFVRSTVVRFELDNNGKITSTYNVRTGIAVPSNLIDRKPITTGPGQTIRSYLKAEDRRDFEKVFHFYSSSMKRYWHLSDPTYNDLKKVYTSNWESTSNSRNDILSITQISQNFYEVEVDFTYKDRQRKENSVRSVIRIGFDKEGRINSVYGVERQNQVTSANTGAENGTFQGDYLYKTTFISNYSMPPVRKQPTIQSDVIYTAPRGSQVYVLERTNQYYYKVSINGYKGFVSKELLRGK